jgi:hypothetical protein
MMESMLIRVHGFVVRMTFSQLGASLMHGISTSVESCATSDLVMVNWGISKLACAPDHLPVVLAIPADTVPC